MSHEALNSPSEPDDLWSRLRGIGKRALADLRMATDAIDRYGRPPVGGVRASKMGYEAEVIAMKAEQENGGFTLEGVVTQEEIEAAANAVQAERLRRPPQSDE